MGIGNRAIYIFRNGVLQLQRDVKDCTRSAMMHKLTQHDHTSRAISHGVRSSMIGITPSRAHSTQRKQIQIQRSTIAHCSAIWPSKKMYQLASKVAEDHPCTDVPSFTLLPLHLPKLNPLQTLSLFQGSLGKVNLYRQHKTWASVEIMLQLDKWDESDSESTCSALRHLCGTCV